MKNSKKKMECPCKMKGVNCMGIVDKVGRTELMYSIIDKEYDKAKKLINNGADINVKDKQGFTALHFAVENNDYEIVEFLINNGANVNAQDKYGNIPLNRAIKPYIDRKIIEILLKFNSDIRVCKKLCVKSI